VASSYSFCHSESNDETLSRVESDAYSAGKKPSFWELIAYQP
jgi:hypothetical protein